jgi:hypothetical protein
MCLYILSSFWDVRFDIRIKAMLGSLYILSFVGGFMSYLRYVCYLLPDGNMLLVYEYIFIFTEPACYECFIIPNETKKTHTCKMLLASIF